MSETSGSPAHALRTLELPGESLRSEADGGACSPSPSPGDRLPLHKPCMSMQSPRQTEHVLCRICEEQVLYCFAVPFPVHHPFDLAFLLVGVDLHCVFLFLPFLFARNRHITGTPDETDKCRH